MWPEKQGLFVPDAGFFLTDGEGAGGGVAQGGTSGLKKGADSKKDPARPSMPRPGQACAKLEERGR
ncbi:hypothetical protein GQ37_012910 [Janthinobacterium sp. BJB1]|nr:hypothetical protein CSQ90_14295 [Janthinobacterium sp. BJB303]PJC98552.1 hypothetical protein GQ37_012910 [Janthinobacterium sp. BJB1]